jgi:hypothetical protein
MALNGAPSCGPIREWIQGEEAGEDEKAEEEEEDEEDEEEDNFSILIPVEKGMPESEAEQQPQQQQQQQQEEEEGRGRQEWETQGRERQRIEQQGIVRHKSPHKSSARYRIGAAIASPGARTVLEDGAREKTRGVREKLLEAMRVTKKNAALRGEESALAAYEPSQDTKETLAILDRAKEQRRRRKGKGKQQFGGASSGTSRMHESRSAPAQLSPHSPPSKTPTGAAAKLVLTAPLTAAVAALEIVSDEIRGVVSATVGKPLVPMGPMDEVLGAFATIRREEYDVLEERGREERLTEGGGGGAAARMKQQLMKEKRKDTREEKRNRKVAGNATERAKRAKEAAADRKARAKKEKEEEEKKQRAAPENLLKGDRIVYQIDDGWTIVADRSLAGDGGTQVVDRLDKRVDRGKAARKWAEMAGLRGGTVLERVCEPRESRANDVRDGATAVASGSSAMLAGSARMKMMADEAQAKAQARVGGGAKGAGESTKEPPKQRRMGKYVWLRVRLDDNEGNMVSENAKVLVVRLTGKGALEGRWARERNGEVEFAKVRAKQRRQREERAYLKAKAALEELAAAKRDGRSPVPMRQAHVQIEASAVHQWISLPNRLGKHVRQQEDYESGRGLRALRAAEERARVDHALALANAAKIGEQVTPKKKLGPLAVANELLRAMGLDAENRTALNLI